ncbi:MAG TPA: hypothetical protein VFP72_05815, partial [Kineosporiaceae bacterium]|nr:hypothetical protein [Kineosporiaceae bacterium]
MTSRSSRSFTRSLAGRGSRAARPAVVASTVVAALVASLLVSAVVPTSQAAAAQAKAPKGQTRPAPVKPLVSRALAKPAGPKPVTTSRVPWPAAGGAAVTLKPGGKATATGTPVTVQDDTAGAGEQRTVQVQVAPRPVAAAAGVDGLVLTVATTTGPARPTTVSVDVRGVADSYGADWASRAQLVELTGCTVTGTGATQTVTGCTGRRVLPTRADRAGTLTATIPPTTTTLAAPSTPTGPSTPAAPSTAAPSGSAPSGGATPTAAPTPTASGKPSTPTTPSTPATSSSGGTSTSGKPSTPATPSVSGKPSTGGIPSAGTSSQVPAAKPGAAAVSGAALSSGTGGAGVVVSPALYSTTRGVVSPARAATTQAATVQAVGLRAAGATGTVSVLAATATAAGSAGSYAATPLNPASSWQAGGASGSFSWSYPVTLPPVPGGLAPSVGIGYDSGSVDGRVATTNNQPSWVGDGFDLSSGYIERRYVSCSEDMTGGNNTVKTGDLCWKSDNATMSFGSRSGPLVKDTATGTWKLYDDDASRITRVGAAGSAGEHWVLTTGDGTVYTFGKGSAAVTGAATGSAWTVPVFGNQPGEPGYVAGNYAGSASTQVWRWNLDSVVDVHGNAVNYFYAPETNRYGQNLNATVADYVRGGYLARIDYGLRTDAPTTQAAAQVVFSTAERCLPSGAVTCDPAQLTAANASSWPDVPFDQLCTAATGAVASPSTGGCPSVVSPAFFTRIRLTGVTARVSTGSSYRDVDRYTITHEFKDPGDNTSKVLWPTAIAHTGVAADGATLAAPTITLNAPQPTPNRVDTIGDTIPAINRFRLSWIDNGLGGLTSIGYTPADCTPADTKKIDPANNTRRCFPVYDTPPGGTSPVLDWFHKYLVSRVVSSDGVGGQVDTVTSYEYVGDPAWHFDRDDLTPQARRTWGQWRGYGKVRAYTGAPSGPWTASESLFLRGMDGDCANTACTTKRSATPVKDSRGGTITDADQHNGYVRETLSYNGATLTFDALANVTGASLGTVVGETLNTPWLSGVHADDGSRQARIHATSAVSARTYTAAGTVDRETQVNTTFDDNGRPTQVEDLGDITSAADDTCTTTTYATDTTHWILAAPTSAQTVAKACSVTPAIPGDVLAAGRTLYDGATDWSATPALTKGEITGTLVATGGDPASGTLTYTQTGTLAYDAVGRVTDSADALGRHTKTAYTPAGVGPVTSVTVTNPANDTASSTLEPGRGVTLTVTDANNRVTTTAYDPLGRLTAVWLPNRATSLSASRTFTYSYADLAANPKTPTKVTSSALRNNGSYASTYAYYDGLLRAFQTQAPSADGTATRIVANTTFDGRGMPVAASGPAWADGVAGSGPVTVADANTPMRVATTYDGVGRVTKSEQRAGIGSANWHTYTTTTSYDGSRTTTTPPAGANPTTSIVDARGRLATLRQYITSAGTGGAFQDTTYTYRADGLLTGMSDPAGNTWTRGYDLRGRLIVSTDPDSGAATSSYDDAGQLTTATDGRGRTRAYAYDKLGRKTEEHTGTLAGTLLASWTYDTAPGGKGQPATSTRYDSGGNAYTREVTGYDALNNATGTKLTIPASETGLAGTYTTTATYNLDGQPAQYREPSVPGLDNEALGYTYTPLGQPSTLSAGTSLLVAATTYSAYGQALTVNEGPSPIHSIYVSYGYQDGTRRLTSRQVTRQGVNTASGAPATTAANSYSYDDAGNLTAVADTPTDPAATGETQCFTYTPLRQLASAWTPTSGDCATAPATSLLGGPAPYWTDWTYDTATGNRTTQTDHATGGNTTTTTYAYPAAKTPQP